MPLPLFKLLEDRASDSDSEQGRRRKSGRRVASKPAKDVEGSASEEGVKNVEREGEKTAPVAVVEGDKAGGDPGKTGEKPQEKGVSEVEAGASSVQEESAPIQPLEVQTSGVEPAHNTEKLSPGRIMTARKSFPAKKARGFSANTEDDDEDSIEEYIEMTTAYSDHSEDAFEMAPLPQDDTSNEGAVTNTPVDSSDISDKVEDNGVSETSSAGTSASDGTNKDVSVDNAENNKPSGSRTREGVSDQSLTSQSKANAAGTAKDAEAPARSAAEETPMDTSAVDVDRAATVPSKGAPPTHTKARASLTTSSSPVKDRRRQQVIPQSSKQDQPQSKPRGEPVVGAVAESRDLQSGTSTPVADFPVGNAGSVIPDRTAFAKSMPAKRSTRQRKPTHFGQRSKRKKSTQAVSDSGKLTTIDDFQL